MSYFKAHHIWFQLGGLCPRPIGGPYSTLQISEVFRRPTPKKREEKGRKEQGQEVVHDAGENSPVATVTGIRLLQRDRPIIRLDLIQLEDIQK